MNTNIIANTDGKGLWTEEVKPVEITQISLGYRSTDYYPEEPFCGELRAYFDASGHTANSWHVVAYGLIYTDKTWLKEFKQGLRQLGLSRAAVADIAYSEQGMQGNDYVSMDIGAKFYASWSRLKFS